MINRTYFIHAKINWGDGKGSYSWRTNLFSVRSFLPDPHTAYQMARDQIAVEAEEMGYDSVEVTCFCRC
jgi:hypothetical protein